MTSVWEYAYHPQRGWLTEVKKDGVVVESYGYDANGNRTTWSDFWGSGTATHDDQDRLLTAGAVSYAYTTNGELLTRTEGTETTSYVYDVVGSLLEVDLPTGVVIEYLTDAAGHRIGKRVNGTLVQGWIYAGGLPPIAETDGSGTITTRYAYGTRVNVPELMVRDGVTYRFVTDYLGSVRMVIDAATGTVAQQLDYDAWGRVIFDSNPAFQPFGFAGGLYDPQTGLTRFGARDYDPEIARWTSKDPVGFRGGSAGFYAYASNDAVNHLDPSGLVDIIAIVWGPNLLKGQVGHVMLMDMEGKAVLSQFPRKRTFRDQNLLLSVDRTFEKEGGSPSSMFLIHAPEDEAFFSAVAQYKSRKFWSAIPALDPTDSTHCADAVGAALAAGGVPVHRHEFPTQLEDELKNLSRYSPRFVSEISFDYIEVSASVPPEPLSLTCYNDVCLADPPLGWPE